MTAKYFVTPRERGRSLLSC